MSRQRIQLASDHPGEGRRAALVMCASIPWGFHRNRQQELAERLSAFLSVLYVEPPQRGADSRGVWSVNDRCYVLPSLPALPGDRVSGRINRSVQHRVATSIRAALAARGQECAVLWIDRIHSVALVEAFPGAQVVYDCVDEEWSFGRLCRRSHLQRLETMLVDRADLVLASSRGLQRRLSAGGRRVDFVPNGCDFAHFSRAAGPRPLDLPPADRPLLGFVGSVTRRALDLSLLARVFSLLPECRFAFVGSADAASAEVIARAANATLLGPKPYAGLPDYVTQFDVCLIPYLVGGRIDYVYPKKFHEYLAAGKPVVATDMPELRAFAGVIEIGRTPEEFVGKIEECLRAQADPARAIRLREERQTVARENTWEKRVEQILALWDSELPSRAAAFAPQRRATVHA